MTLKLALWTPNKLYITYVFSFSYSYCVAHVIKKLELPLFLIYAQKIKFEHTKIGVLEILMLRTACINPWFLNIY